MKSSRQQYIHVGGDECPKVRWEKCPKCQARIKALGLKSDDVHSKEERLQSFVINQLEKFLNDHGRRIIGWDEILEGGLAPNATVMSWRGEKGGIEAAKQKHDVIMTPNTYLYFDYYQAKDVDNEPFGIGGYLPSGKSVQLRTDAGFSDSGRTEIYQGRASQPLDRIHRYLPSRAVHGIASLGCIV